MEKFRNKYRIGSARAKWHDYNGGIYFITICTKNRMHYFGEIVQSGHVQSGHAPIPNETAHENETAHGNETAHRNETAHENETAHAPFLQPTEIANYTNDCIINLANHNRYANVIEYIIMPNHLHLLIEIDETKKNEISEINPENIVNKKMQDISKRKGLLSVAIGSLKSAITKYANENDIVFGWQSRFHDHIVRDDGEFERIKNYIINNPKNWKDDKFFS